MNNYSRIRFDVRRSVSRYFLNLSTKSISIFVFIFLFSSWVQGQTPEPTFTNYDNDDGLPSSEVYYALQDRSGYMWFATDRGVVRYNGYEFETFTEEDGLINNVVFTLYEDVKGRIWMLGYTEKLCYYFEGKIYHYRYNQQLSNFAKSKYRAFISLHVSEDENLYIGTKALGVINVNQKGKVRPVLNLEQGASGIMEVENKLIPYHIAQPDSPINSKHNTSLYYENEPVCEVNQDDVSRPKGILADNENVCVSIGSTLLLYNRQKKQLLDQRRYSNKITSIQKIDDVIYVGVYHGGLDTYTIHNDSLKHSSSMLSAYTPSSITRDSFGGLWITTTEKGIFYSPNLGITSLNFETGLTQNYIESIEENHSVIYLGYQNGFESYWQSKTTHKLQYHSYGKTAWDEEQHRINGCNFMEFNRLIIDLCQEKVYPYKNAVVRKVFKHEQDWYVFIGPGFWEIQNNQMIFNEFNLKNGVVETGIFWKDDIYIGTKMGLFKVTPDDTLELAEHYPLLGNRVVDLAISKSHGLVVATRGAGLLFYKDQKIIQIS